MFNIKNLDKRKLIKNAFLLPIIIVVIVSISHVITWYDLGNPFVWAIYLSIGVEIFALSAVSAVSVKEIKKGSIWILFGIVTSIQIMGNVFFTYNDINIESKSFLNWIELIEPFFEDWTITDHKRLLAILQGATLPFMSLISLHFYIKFDENSSNNNKNFKNEINDNSNSFNDNKKQKKDKKENKSNFVKNTNLNLNKDQKNKKQTKKNKNYINHGQIYGHINNQNKSVDFKQPIFKVLKN